MQTISFSKILNVTTGGPNNGAGILLADKANHNIIDSCTINAPTVTSTINRVYGILISSDTLMSTIVGSNTFDGCDSNTISNNTVVGGHRGIYIRGNSTNRSTYNTVSNNTVQDFYYSGIYFYYNDNSYISNNEVTRPNRTNTNSTVEPITLYFSDANIVEKNHVHNIFNASLSSGVYFERGILIGQNSLSATPTRVENNLIEDINTLGIQEGIELLNTCNVEVWHNTVVLDDASASSVATYGVRVIGTLSSILNIRNNNVYVIRNTSSSNYGLSLSNNTSAISDYNNVYVANGSNNYFGHIVSPYTTLANWQTGTSKGTNSTSLDPQFANIASGDFTPTNISLLGTGTALGVTDDINGTTRSLTTPTVGAVETTCVPMAGTYTINQSLAASAINFTTIDSAVLRLQDCGISAAVIFNVASGQTFNEQISIPEIDGASATNTITFNGNGSTLAFNGTSVPLAYTLRLDGADYFRFDSFSNRKFRFNLRLWSSYY